jgi:hypothetical protein
MTDAPPPEIPFEWYLHKKQTMPPIGLQHRQKIHHLGKGSSLLT